MKTGEPGAAAFDRRSQDARDPYTPIRDYALIGDCHGSALISKTGSIDWCCLKRFDADPIFCSILDQDRGGFFSIAPMSQFASNQTYRTGTNILVTEFRTETGSVGLRDFIRGADKTEPFTGSDAKNGFRLILIDPDFR